MAIDPVTGLEVPETTTALTPPASEVVQESTPLQEDTALGKVEAASDQYAQTGQAQAQGDAGPYAGYVNPAEAVEAVGPEQGEVYSTPETTVAGQLEKLLESDSPLRQQARREAREGASALGMMSSSAAIGDVYGRQVKALTPVAAQDAETMAKFKLQQQATENKISEVQTEAEVSGALTQQKAEVTEKSNRINQEWQAIMKGMDAEASAALEEQRQEWGVKMKTLEGDITRELRQQEIDAGVEQTIVTNAHDAMNNYQITVQNLLANESFLDNFAGNATAMKNYFDDLFVTVESSIRYQAKAAGVYWDETTGEGLKPYIDDLAAQNEWA